MAKKTKNQLAELLELSNAQKGIKMKKRSIQFECCHKNGKGVLALKSTNNPYVFKCKICKDKKVDLSILDPKRGEIKEQLKDAFKIIKSASDLAKIQSSNKDAETVKLIAGSLKKTWASIKILGKALKDNRSNKKKFKKQSINTASGGRSLFR